ncbi:MAG: LytTR family DNA-binding domain-containing protein [Pseudomonadota bacterium]|nr:LytTR family DNA-binding domain-containing protein [Pseudomonadota bacterium]
MSVPYAIVAEDEAPQRESLCDALAQLWPELQVLACADGISALEAAAERRPQIAFLDIRMPGANGIEVAYAIRQHAQIVFTTAYDEFAVKAFEAGAVDYLLKPIRPQRLAETVARLKERLAQPMPAAFDVVLEALRLQLHPGHGARERLRWITASIGGTTRMLPIDDVLYFQAQDKYTCVVTANSEALIRTPLKDLLQTLDERLFWQVHRSVIVRADAVDHVRRDELGKYQLWLRGRDECLPLSSAFQHRFKAM